MKGFMIAVWLIISAIIAFVGCYLLAHLTTLGVALVICAVVGIRKVLNHI